MELTREELNEIMKKKWKGNWYEKLCKGEVKADIQDCITFFIEGYKASHNAKEKQHDTKG